MKYFYTFALLFVSLFLQAQSETTASDREIKHILYELEDIYALKDPVKKAKGLKEVELEIEEHFVASDYRYTYARVISESMTASSHKSGHAKAYVMLKRAAQIAIDNEKASEMYGMLEKHKSNLIKNLANGHPTDYNPIMRALKENDKALMDDHHGDDHH